MNRYQQDPFSINFIRDVREIPANVPVLIWGAGVFGEELYILAHIYNSRRKVYVTDYFDNKIQNVNGGITRDTVSQIIEENPDLIFVITVGFIRSVMEIMQDIRRLKKENGLINEILIYVPQNPDEWENKRRHYGYYINEKLKKGVEADRSIEALMNAIGNGEPFLLSRWGYTEGKSIIRSKYGFGERDEVLFQLRDLSGVYPANFGCFKDFVRIMEASIEKVDFLIGWKNFVYMDALIQLYSPEVTVLDEGIMEPFFASVSWCSALEGKKVLVIHPFAEDIKRQYLRRGLIWGKRCILPEFNLVTYKAVQSLGGKNVNYKNWKQALLFMEKEISNIDFDIALIGCGAYGMPLGAYIKSKLHKKAIHLGGCIQILFGIKGRRWEEEGYEYEKKIYNPYWIRPGEYSKPDNWREVEGGCYW